MSEYESMTIDELTELNRDYWRQRDDLKKKQMEIIRVREKKTYELQGKEPPIKEQVIGGVGAIESGEAIGGLAKKPIQIYVITAEELAKKIQDKSLFKKIIEAVKGKIK